MDNWLAIITTIIGILAGWLITYFYKGKKEVTILIENVEVFTKDKLPEGLSISYLAQPVICLTKSTVYLWNSGNTTIKRDDITNEDSLQFVSKASTALIINENHSRDACNIKLIPSENREVLLINFDFLDKKDGFSFNVIHDSQEIPEINGTIIGTKIRNLSKKSSHFKKVRTYSVLKFFVLTMPLLQLIYTFVTYLLFNNKEILNIACIMLGSYSVILYYYVLNQKLMKIPKKLIVKE